MKRKKAREWWMINWGPILTGFCRHIGIDSKDLTIGDLKEEIREKRAAGNMLWMSDARVIKVREVLPRKRRKKK